MLERLRRDEWTISSKQSLSKSRSRSTAPYSREDQVALGDIRAEIQRVKTAERQATWLLERFPRFRSNVADHTPPTASVHGASPKNAAEAERGGDAVAGDAGQDVPLTGDPQRWSALELRAELRHWEVELLGTGRSASTVTAYRARISDFLAWIATR